MPEENQLKKDPNKSIPRHVLVRFTEDLSQQPSRPKAVVEYHEKLNEMNASLIILNPARH